MSNFLLLGDDDKNLGKALTVDGGHEWNSVKIFWIANAFPSNLNTINVNVFPTMVEYTVWEKIQKIFWYEIKTWGACRNTRWCILEVNPEGLGPEGLGWWSTNMFVYHFVDPEFGFEIFLKKTKKTRGNRKNEYWCWHRLLGHHCLLVLGLKKISCGACLYYLMLFWWQKRIAFKSSWTWTFIPYWTLDLLGDHLDSKGKNTHRDSCWCV